MVFGYLRVSSELQDTESQKHQIQTYCNSNDMQIDNWLEFTISTKRNIKERGIDDLLTKLKRKDILIISELSRLGRSIKELNYIIDQLVKKKIQLICLKQNIHIKYDNGNGLDMQSKILLHVLSLVAEIERDMISERAKAGHARLKAMGIPRGNKDIGKYPREKRKKAIGYNNSLKELVTGLIEQGYNQRQIRDKLNELGISTLTGKGKWLLISVQKLLADCGLKTKRARKEKQLDDLTEKVIETIKNL